MKRIIISLLVLCGLTFLFIITVTPQEVEKGVVKEIVPLEAELVVEEKSSLCDPIATDYSYNEQIGTLTFASGVVAPVIYGNPDDAFVSAMELGAAFDPTSSFPGEDTTTVIAGHKTDDFAELENVELGDKLVLEIGSNEYVYEVTNMEVIEDSDVDKVYYDENDLVIYTCYPFYYEEFYSQRYMVSAELVTEVDC